MEAAAVADEVTEGGAIRCLRCKQWIGETDDQLELVGIGRGREFAEMYEGLKRIWKCKCGWMMVFRKK
jgi:hypothetical protein